MGSADTVKVTRGQWMTLAAALLGWMFDGLEQGLFPLVARPAVMDLLHLPAQLDPETAARVDQEVGFWMAIATSAFLIGAATGGVLFGWLGDRIGRVRAMTLSVLTYALFSGLCGLAGHPWQITVLRFFSALGMGGEWSLGVALVMEMWPDRARGMLAGLIGAAANVGILLIGVIGRGLMGVLPETASALRGVGLPESWVTPLVAHSGWRLLMFVGAAPALLTFFIRLFVPESERWQQEQRRGTGHWPTRDLVGVLIGAGAAAAVLYVWAGTFSWPVRIAALVAGLLVPLAGFTYPVVRYLQRTGTLHAGTEHALAPTLRRMLLAACLSGVPLLGTWGANLWIPTWVGSLPGSSSAARANALMISAFGAICGTIVGALLAHRFGRRIIYVVLCLASLASSQLLYRFMHAYNPAFLAVVFVVGASTAAFYGWLPLYLPELFRTGVRATGQGFSYNFGRILAALGVLQTGTLLNDVFEGNMARALSVISLIYVLGLVLIWLAPETHGKPLPE